MDHTRVCSFSRPAGAAETPGPPILRRARRRATRAIPSERPPRRRTDGLAALGGNGNREDGSTGVEVACGGSMRAEDVDKKSPVKLAVMLKE